MGAKRKAIFRARGLLHAGSLLALLAAWPGEAKAQRSGDLIKPPKPDETPAPAPPRIELPTLQKDEGAVYPAAALRTRGREAVRVVLVLDLDATGAVTKAAVETPAGDGFDEAAL